MGKSESFLLYCKGFRKDFQNFPIISESVMVWILALDNKWRQLKTYGVRNVWHHSFIVSRARLSFLWSTKGESLRKRGKCNKNCKWSEVGTGISGRVASNRAKLSDTQIDTSCIELCDQKSGLHTTHDPGSKFGLLALFVAFAAFSQRFPFSLLLN